MLLPDTCTVDVSVDWISDKLYYLDNCNRYIGVVDLATNQYKILVSSDNVTYYSYGIIVDPTTRLESDSVYYENKGISQ